MAGYPNAFQTLYLNRHRYLEYQTEYPSRFRKADRPPVPSDNIGPYKYIYNDAGNDIEFNADTIALVLGISATQVKEFKETGTVNIEGLFKYWEDEKATSDGASLLEIARQELDMYNWH
jgi:hypothetical protein